MIISHKHKFIYIKCRKVAGSSMELALASICDENDIITEDPCRPPVARNFNQPYSLLKDLSTCNNAVQIARALRDKKSRPAFYSHIDARSIKSRIGSEKWNSYFKFTFERNPWDKCVSWYYWYYRRQFKYGKKDPPAPTFRDHMLMKTRFIDRNFPKDWRRYTIRDQVAVDFIGRYENILHDFRVAMSKIGINLDLTQNDKSDFRDAKSRNMDNMYDNETKNSVERLFADEIRHLGYEYPA